MFYLLGEVLNVPQSSISFVNLKVYQLNIFTHVASIYANLLEQ